MGEGTLELLDGRKIKASWKSNIIEEQKARITYPDGGIYEGEINGEMKRNGDGKMIF